MTLVDSPPNLPTSEDDDGSGDARPYVVIGGGPAGLSAGYLLAKAGRKVIVLEAEDQVGGIAKTVVDPDGYRFDLGGHRFFTKNKEVDALWHEIMGDEFLKRPRMSRIFWRGKYLDYPLKGTDVIKKLGPIELTRCGISYLWALVKPKGPEDNFEQWVSNRFGKRLYSHFFKGYTEKVWGVSTTELRSEWAAQRIKGLSFFSAAKAAFFGNKDNEIKSLIDAFNYPRYGPGQMWEMMTERIEEMGGEVRLECPATRIEVEDGRVVRIDTPQGAIEPRGTISSLPLRHMVGLTSPGAPAEVQKAAQGLRYRDFMTVALILDGEDLFPDNWIYIHEDGVRVGRIQNYRSWSPWMVPDPDTACVGLEYFAFKGDDLWTMDDDKLVELATRELDQLGLATPDKVRRGYVVRVPLAYPMYDETYAERVSTIRGWLDPLQDFVQVGRNGLHRYNNSDHSMLSAMRAVDNILKGTEHDIWAVNVESVYHEEETDADNENPYHTVPTTVYEREPLISNG
ncbi:MAG TPA: NAD(P)/FAD-dependent oxidoreductase [Baekduia sp.]|uniref:NAD(P)/FAD-dependent oxidoreductase n=1 Tax=Baekduia sp. TaxID=2600305 RepID=UPI002B528D6D|nr:NAD(P)/FAD-dependent oxidoreductase [Baekduia sp.]HMJ34017.1 NAD(P)/FAD-dependent oxidoreductase [Baekduia sp.]